MIIPSIKIYLHAVPYGSAKDMLKHDNPQGNFQLEKKLSMTIGKNALEPEFSGEIFVATKLHTALFGFCHVLLVTSLKQNMTPEEAREFATKLEADANRLAALKSRSKGCVEVDYGQIKTSDFAGKITWGDIIATRVIAEIRRGARWYRSVSQVGFGVRVETILEE